MPRRTPHTKIGAAVRRLRLAAGLTQNDLAALVEIAPETMSRIETNRAGGVSMSLATKFAEALKAPVADLFKEPTEPKRSKLRPGEQALLTLVSRLDDTQLEDVVRMLRLVARV